MAESGGEFIGRTIELDDVRQHQLPRAARVDVAIDALQDAFEATWNSVTPAAFRVGHAMVIDGGQTV